MLILLTVTALPMPIFLLLNAEEEEIAIISGPSLSLVMVPVA